MRNLLSTVVGAALLLSALEAHSTTTSVTLYNNLAEGGYAAPAYNYSITTYCGTFCGYQTTGYYNVVGMYFNSGQATSISQILEELYVPPGYQGNLTIGLAAGPSGSVSSGSFFEGNVGPTYISGDSITGTLSSSSFDQSLFSSVNWAVTPNTNYELVLQVPYTSGVETNLTKWVENPSNATLAAEVVGSYQTPVPLPAAGWLMISGLGVLGAKARRRASR